jgi:hypothetical protein
VSSAGIRPEAKYAMDKSDLCGDISFFHPLDLLRLATELGLSRTFRADKESVGGTVQLGRGNKVRHGNAEG